MESSPATPWTPAQGKDVLPHQSGFDDLMNSGHRHGSCVDAGVVAHLEQPSTPQPTSSPSIAESCKEHLKPMVGMIFDTLTDVEKFYKSYAHEARFSVRVSQHKKQNEEILFKRYYCSREGCGCEAHIVVKLGSDKKYRISSMIEEHSHGFVSPDKRHLLRSNRTVSERAKSTLFSCHKASIGTSQAFRLLQVSDGGFQNVGCTLRDLQNYYRDLRSKIKDADAQMFVGQLERKKEVNPAFFYEFMVDKQGRLVRVFWADAICRKNYSVFGDVLSATGGVAPRLIIIDEDASMKAAIAQILPNTVHRLCMWHTMEKVPEKVGPSIREDGEFWDRLHKCVWGSEDSDNFESEWNSIMAKYGLIGNEWFSTKFDIRQSWIPAYFMDIPLVGILRTTSRSESANSFFNRFIHRKLTFVEFWLRFDTALECQRQEELKADNTSLHTNPKLMTPWDMEKQCSGIYTHEVFSNLLDEKAKDPMEVAMRKKISDSRNKFEDLIQMAKNSEQGMEFLYSSLSDLVEPLQKIIPAATVNKQDEFESFLGSKIPDEVEIHPPNDIKSKGPCKRIKKSKEKKAPRKRKRGKCKQVVDHDARNCPNNTVG
uniref:MULE transposase domain-containing protein n=1 Tax=Oryza meridionalis TaxID=40149 RepID=A0A0E0F3Z3_9ORYZ